jgi:methyl-accepting chemotaxis protein
MPQAVESNVRFDLIAPDALALLRKHSGFLLREMDRTFDEFHQRIYADPETARFFSSDSVKRHAKEMQLRHWRLILTGAFDEDYDRSVRRIGETHKRLGLEPRWFIGGQNYVISNVCEAIALRMPSRWVDRTSAAQRAKLQSAFIRAAIYDMEIALSVYFEAERRQRTQALEDVATELDASIAVIVKSVAAAASELQMAADFMNRALEEVAGQAAAVADASSLTSSNVSAVSAATGELTSSIAEIAQQAQMSHEIAGSSLQMARTSEAQIEHLSHATEGIGGIVDMINAIAGQTNMLALNATIEAARAGEAGRGFAVVAQEVKALAEQTGKATGEITTKIAAIQAATRNVAANIARITHVTDETSKAATGISAAVEEQGAATRDIARNVTEALHSVDSIARSVQAVSAAAGNTASAATQVLAFSKSMTDQSRDLKLTVDRFLHSIRGKTAEGSAPASHALPEIELFGSGGQRMA